MNREQAREEIRHRAKEWLTPDKSGKGYICPICGSGSGRNGTGITTADGIHFTCWAGCFSSADIIDIIGLKNGLTDYTEKLKAASEIFWIDIDGIASMAPPRSVQTKIHSQSDQQQKSIRKSEAKEVDYTEFFEQANAHLTETDYHRGISLETLNSAKVGYVAEWRHPKAPPTVPTSPRLIIPTSSTSYLARDTRANLSEEQKKYAKSKVGTVHIFNAGAVLYAQQPIFIVEGEIDALSILDVGGDAVGLGSINNVKALLTMLQGQHTEQPFIICLDDDDNDKARRNVARALQELKEGLNGLNIPYIVADISAPYKDANEALQADKGKFAGAVHQAIGQAQDVIDGKLAADEVEQEMKLKKAQEELHAESAASYVQDFINSIIASKSTCFTPTGFPNLDEILDGGLYAGLYIVGALSSLGKTTFCLQVADQVAQLGRDVLIFSLEMARNELIAKSVSRLTLIQDLEQNSSTKSAKTTRGILTGSRYKRYSSEEMALIQEAMEIYADYSKQIYITEGVGSVGVEQIRARVERHVQVTGTAPVVLIDYLQILAPSDVRATDKQNTDRAVMELKRISRDYNTPVIGISSFNRENYYSPVSLTSFKESGAIEYSSDVLIGLQYEGMEYQEGEKPAERAFRLGALFKANEEKAKRGEAQQIELKVLKNRNGSKGKCSFEFYPMFNYFTESTIILPEDIEDIDDELEEIKVTYGKK